MMEKKNLYKFIHMSLLKMKPEFFLRRKNDANLNKKVTKKKRQSRKFIKKKIMPKKS